MIELVFLWKPTIIKCGFIYIDTFTSGNVVQCNCTGIINLCAVHLNEMGGSHHLISSMHSAFDARIFSFT